MHSATGKENEHKNSMDKKVIIGIDNVNCDNNDMGSFLLELRTRMDVFLFDGSMEHVDADVCNTIWGSVDGISGVLSSLQLECTIEDFNKEVCDDFIVSSCIRRMNIML